MIDTVNTIRTLSLVLLTIIGVASAQAGNGYPGHTTVHNGGRGNYHGNYHEGNGYYARGGNGYYNHGGQGYYANGRHSGRYWHGGYYGGQYYDGGYYRYNSPFFIGFPFPFFFPGFD